MIAAHGSIDVRLSAPAARSRRQVALRVLAGPAIGQFGPIGLLALPLGYLIIPLVAAFHLRADGPEAFARDEVPRLAQGVGWLVALQAWATCVVDRFPLPHERAVLDLELRASRPPSPGLALARLVHSAPRGALLLLASLAAVPVWLAAMFWLAATGRHPVVLSAPLRWLVEAHARFFARHASLIRP